MREKNIKHADSLNVYCSANAYTENPSEIKLPTYIHDDVISAQEKAGAPDWRSDSNDAYVYKLSITDASFDEISNKLRILISGNIKIEEIIKITRNADGTFQRTDRTTLQ